MWKCSPESYANNVYLAELLKPIEAKLVSPVSLTAALQRPLLLLELMFLDVPVNRSSSFVSIVLVIFCSLKTFLQTSCDTDDPLT